MKSLLPLLVILSFYFIISPSPLKNNEPSASAQKRVMSEIRNFRPGQSVEDLKQRIHQLCSMSILLKNTSSTVSFFSELLNRESHSQVYYYLYHQLAKLSEKERKKYLKRALEYSENDSERLESLVRLYEYHREKGDIKREILYLEKQVEIRKQYGDIRSLRQLYIMLGDYHLYENNLIRSLQNFLEARKQSEKIMNVNNGYIYNRIAKVFSLLGRKNLALKFLRESLKCADKYKNEHLRMWVFNIYTELYLSEKDYNKAGYYNDLSLEIAGKENFPELKLRAFYLQSQISFNAGNELAGLTALKSAVDSGISMEAYDHLLPVLYEFIKKAISYGNYTIASSYLNTMDEIYAPFFKGYFFYYFLKGFFFENKGDLKNAGIFYRKTFNSLEYFFAELNQLRHYPFRKEITFIYSMIARYNFKMFDLTHEIGYLTTALYAGEAKNPHLFSQVPDRGRRAESITGERKRIESEIRSVEKKISALSLPESKKVSYRKKLNSLITELTEIEDLIHEFPKRYKRFHISELDIGQIQRSIDKDTVIIRFIVLEDNSFAFVIDQRSAGYKKLEKSSLYIKNLTGSLLSPIDRYENGDVDFLSIKYDLVQSEQLYQVLLYEILEFQTDKKKLIIIPDEFLFRLPFEALATKIGKPAGQPDTIFSEYENAGFLIDDYSVEYLLSLFHLKNGGRSGNKRYEISAYGFPEIRPGSEWLSGDPVLDPLPSSLEEIEIIKEIWGKKRGRFFTGADFTKANFESTAPRSRIIHLATHYISNKDYPWYSLLVFSPGINDDPLYYVSDISKLKLDCDLIFLSTCNSSENHLMSKQMISGMTASLYNSGTRAMIASFWPVNQFSSRIITPFYTSLRKEKGSLNNLPDLMRKVKISFRKQNMDLGNGLKISFSHPLIWANFNLYRFFIKN